MNGSKEIAKKRLLSNKSRTVIMAAVFSLLIAALFSVVSVSAAYGRGFISAAETIGEEPEALFREGVTNVSEFAVFLSQQFHKAGGGDKSASEKNQDSGKADERDFGETKEDARRRLERAPVRSFERRGFERSGDERKDYPASDLLFSARSGYVNLPVYIIVCVLITLLCVRITISIIFSVYEKERRKFFALLMVSGADRKFIRSAARYEGLYIFALSVPFGLLIGCAEIIGAKLILKNVIEKIASEISVNTEPLNIKISLIAALISAAFVLLNILGVSKKACKKLYMKNASAEIRKSIGANIGNRVFSAKEKAYKRRGIEHYVAVRNFSGGISRYIKVFFITAVCMGLSGISLMVFVLSKNYNSEPVTEKDAAILAAGLASHTFSCTVAVLLIVILLICLFCVIVSNNEINSGEYMMMRALGLNLKKVKKCAAIESRVCIAIGFVCGTFSIYWFWNFVMENYYLYQSDISFRGGEKILIAVGAQIILYIAVAAAAALYSKKVIKNTDLIKTLKDFSC